MNRVVIITGGTDGLGKELAQILKTEDTVVVVSNDEQSLNMAKESMQVDGYLCDVTKQTEIAAVVAEVTAKYGKIDVLVNNAGIGVYGPLETTDPKRINEVIEVNTIGSIQFAREVILPMKNQKSGKILNVISTAGLIAQADKSVYNASKWALTGFTDSLREELAEDNISVMGFYPGTLNTKFFEKAGIPNKDMSYAIDVKEAAKIMQYMLSFDDLTFTTVAIRHILQK